MIEVTPNNNPVLKSTKPFRQLLNEPIKLVEPTTNKEYDVASMGDTPNRYTKTGTVSIEPPPPINPNDMPMNNEAIYPAMCIQQSCIYVFIYKVILITKPH